MDEKYILYVKVSCPFCNQAEELLRAKDKSYFMVPFDTQLETLAHMKLAYSHETVPMVFRKVDANIEFIGGYTDLEKHLSE